MYRGTTPTLCLSLLTSLDLAEVEDIWVTLKAPSMKMTFSGEEVLLDVVEKKAYLFLSQEDTLSFGVGKVKVQARILMGDGKAFATDVQEISVDEILMEGVLCHGQEDGVPDDPSDDTDGGVGSGGSPDEGGGEGGAAPDVGG